MWVAGLIEEILAVHGTREIPTGGGRKRSYEAREEEDNRPDARTGGRGGSHKGIAQASEVLAGEERLTGRHFPDKAPVRGNCALCYACHPNKMGEKQVVWCCPDCNVRLHVPECFRAWHTEANPKSPFVDPL
mmetsp:Transcript_32111/g.66468  ORF Transcript_32111/g.66468 Transcript_32111/m.66468 type:complete len:132 (+) Transcript_32111:350-745(+)